MRFSDFFLSYKIRLKSIKSFIPLVKLPTYRKILALLFLILTILLIIFRVLNFEIGRWIVSVLEVIAGIIFLIMDATKKNLSVMLENHYKPYSKERMKLIRELFNEYHLDSNDNSTIDLLISESETEKIACDFLLPLQKPLKALMGLIIPIVAFVAKKFAESYEDVNNLLKLSVETIIIVICIFSMGLALGPAIKGILYRDYNKYSELIYDLRQLKIFKDTHDDNQ